LSCKKLRLRQAGGARLDVSSNSARNPTGGLANGIESATDGAGNRPGKRADNSAGAGSNEPSGQAYAAGGERILCPVTVKRLPSGLINSKSGISDCPSFAIRMIGWPSGFAIHQTDAQQLEDSLRARRRIGLSATTTVESVQLLALQPDLDRNACRHRVPPCNHRAI
jgi:hypothetical protein